MVLPKVRRMLKTGPRRAAGHRCCPAAVAFTFLRDSRIINILLYFYYYYYCEEQRIPSQSMVKDAHACTDTQPCTRTRTHTHTHAHAHTHALTHTHAHTHRTPTHTHTHRTPTHTSIYRYLSLWICGMICSCAMLRKSSIFLTTVLWCAPKVYIYRYIYIY